MAMLTRLLDIYTDSKPTDMVQWEQYEVWILVGGKWEMIASFADFELASAIVRNRSTNVRLIHATYEDGKMVSQDVLAELGMVREEYSA